MNTFKSYYYPSDVEDDSFIHKNEHSNNSRKRTNSNEIDVFFEEANKKKRKTSSTVARAYNDGVSYISTNQDDLNHASHLIKIEVYNLKKLAKIPTNHHWKHADVRLKYYTKANENQNFERTKNAIFHITKEISEANECKKYFIKNGHA